MASALATTCSLTRPTFAKPSGVAALRRPATSRLNVPRTRLPLAPKASAYEVFQLAEEAAKQYGSVDAPSWVLPVGIVAVTLASILSGFVLKPGDDAAKQIQQRDSKSGRWTK